MKRYFVLFLFLIVSYRMHAEENFLLIDGSTNEVVRGFGTGLGERTTPASTFKIALSLMGYDAEILQDEEHPTWQFQEGYDVGLPSWRQSQTPRSWMKTSCVWFSKIIASQIGLEKIEKYLSALDYGNQDFSQCLISPEPISPAWISSSLKISPIEQVKFIQKLVQGALPLSKHSLQTTRKLLFKEILSPENTLFGKTGLGNTVDVEGKCVYIRWFVGWLETPDNFFPFAYLLREHEIDCDQTVPRVKSLLE